MTLRREVYRLVISVQLNPIRHNAGRHALGVGDALVRSGLAFVYVPEIVAEQSAVGAHANIAVGNGAVLRAHIKQMHAPFVLLARKDGNRERQMRPRQIIRQDKLRACRRFGRVRVGVVCKQRNRNGLPARARYLFGQAQQCHSLRGYQRGDVFRRLHAHGYQAAAAADMHRADGSHAGRQVVVTRVQRNIKRLGFAYLQLDNCGRALREFRGGGIFNIDCQCQGLRRCHTRRNQKRFRVRNRKRRAGKRRRDVALELMRRFAAQSRYRQKRAGEEIRRRRHRLRRSQRQSFNKARRDKQSGAQVRMIAVRRQLDCHTPRLRRINQHFAD